MHLVKFEISYNLVVDGSACSKLSNTQSHLLGSIPVKDMESKKMSLSSRVVPPVSTYACFSWQFFQLSL